MTERTATVEVGRQSLRVREWGERGTPVVLFVHGAGDDGRQAAPLGAVLSDRWRVVAPDVSADPEAYRPSRVVALIVGLLDTLGIESAALIGFSWGASICCHLAARHPGRARSLVLLEGGHLDFRDVRGFDASEIPADGSPPAAMARGLVDEPVAETYPALCETAVPLLLVTGLRDEALERLLVDPLRRLETEIPQATIARVSGDGHDLLGADDGTVVGLVRDWLLVH